VAGLPLTFACGYYDRMEALRTGEIRPEGIDLDYLDIQAPREIFDRMVSKREFDASELSCSEFIAQTGAGKCPFVAIPVFPSRMFRHGFICINTKAGIRAPKDLEGKRVGLPMYTQTAAIWLRGILQHEYGVDLGKLHWVQGAVEKGGTHGNPKVMPLLEPVPVEINETGRSLGDLLAAGEIDAIIGSRLPETLGKHPDVARLFPDYRAIEREYYRNTRIHPIMHLTVFRKEVYEKDPWIAQSLYDACCKSKDRALELIRFSGAPRLMLPWLFPDLDEVDELFGGDPWPYGIEANRPTLEAMMTYMVEQDFIAEAIPLEELFVISG
jgi:4,5-dihydroxyphthalate decarboxylase